MCEACRTPFAIMDNTALPWFSLAILATHLVNGTMPMYYIDDDKGHKLELKTTKYKLATPLII